MEINLAMKELERGREYVIQLQRLIWKSDSGEDDDGALTTSYAQDLASKVEDSLRNAILLLNNQHFSGVSADSPSNSDESHLRSESKSSINTDPTRFSPQKRKSIKSWEDCSKIGPKEDGYAWRKYGEKLILNAKHPRCYFRCSYKNEEGCEATKQVQIIQDDPPLYRTTYFGHHTCTKPHMFLDSHNLSSSKTTHFINFVNNNHNNSTTIDQNNMKQENINDYVPSLLSSDDCLVSPGEAVPFESDDLMDAISSSKIWRLENIASD